MKSFRKTICLAVAIIFAFAPVVSAAGPKCAQCQSPKSYDELQFKTEQGDVERISYEDQTYGGEQKRWGYNDRSQANERAKAIFQVCNCDNTLTNFKLGKIIGLKLTILNEGVYWTDENVAIQPFAAYANACNAMSDFPGSAPNVSYNNTNGAVTGGTVYMPRVEVIDGLVVPTPGYDDHDGETVIADYLTQAGGGYDALTAAQVRTTSDIAEYQYFSDAASTKLLNRANLQGVGTTATGTVPVAARAKVVQIKKAYQIGILDQKYGLAYWWIDLPQMVQDTSAIMPMSKLRVKIEALAGQDGGVCVGDCRAICECELTLGTYGTDRHVMYFPYVLTQSDPWGSGIVVTNLMTSATKIENMTADFVLTDSTGKEFTYSKNDFEGAVWVKMMDDVLNEFTGGTPAPGAAWLKVETNFPVDGYEFLTNGIFGAGTLPRTDLMQEEDGLRGLFLMRNN